MSDSTSVIADLLLTANTVGQAPRANDLFNAASPAMLYALDPATTTDLTWGYIGGRLGDNAIANGTVALTDNDDNYIVAEIADGSVSVSTGTTDWDNSTDYLRLYKVTTVSGAIDDFEDHRQLIGGGAGGSSFTGGTLSSPLNEAPIDTMASASTVNIGAADANTISISGTTTITAFDTIASGAIRRLIFQGVLTLTHNGTSLILPTGANITTAAGDVAAFVSLGSGNWRCVGYMRADGSALAAASGPQIPQNSQSTAYTLVLSDAGKHILHPTADNNARTFTIPANGSVAYPVGTAITFVNQINTVTIAITSDTLVLAGAGSTGSRTLAANGVATALKIASTTWIISGTGLT